MDPLTQGVVGAILPQATHKRSDFFLAGLFGLIGGMVPDLDTFIRSEQDPLLYLEFHRHFTHSLVFIPLGGFICAVFLHMLIGKRQSLKFIYTYIFCTLGYATHGLLDAATSYGTMLFWPFNDERIAWSYISIIDPLFTLPILILAVLSAWRKKIFYARLALVWGVLYLGGGAYQNHRAEQMGYRVAHERGHKPVDLIVKPSFGNLLVWKVIYRHDATYYVDAVRVGYQSTLFNGTSIQALDIKRDFPWLSKESQQASDIERFRWFSKGYLAKDPSDPYSIIDLRYSLLPNEINGLWSIKLSPTANKDAHVDFVTHRNASQVHRRKLWQMITSSGG